MAPMDNNPTTHEGIKSLNVANNPCEWSNNSDICICVVTWNINGQLSYEDLAEVVRNDRNFDLLVVGLQEVPRYNISRLLQEALLESYVLLEEATMQSLQLFVFGSKDSDLFVKEVKVDKQSVGGLGGLIGRKKGAVAIRINYKGIRMMFVSCHLSAHAHKVEERNSECRHISHSLFSKKWNPYSKPTQITVWLGDLNYRIQGIDTHPARNLIRKDLHSQLTSLDQLLLEAERGQIFDGYCEGTLTFKPTYKYNIGTSNYDTSYKVRVPSWTDRILFKIQDMEEMNVTLDSYESMDNIYSSDHKPLATQSKGTGIRVSTFLLTWETPLSSINTNDPKVSLESFKNLIDHEQITLCIMDWLYEIVKDYSDKVSEGHCYEKYGEVTTSYAPSFSGLGTSMTETWSENENKGIDHAIALSLLEENQKEKCDCFQWEEDEQLARALQESLSVESPPRYGNEVESPPRYGNEVESPPRYGNEVESPPRYGNEVESSPRYGNEVESPPRYGNEVESPPRYGNEVESSPRYGNENTYQPHMPFYFPMGNRVCAGCNTEIGFFGRSLNCLGAVWHPECFRCHACNLPISDYEFSTSGNYPYHKSCIRENDRLICDVCKHIIPTSPGGSRIYRSHPFLNQKYCLSHEYDNTPRCCSCVRMEARDTRYETLDDGRKFCQECHDSAIMTTDECQPLYLDIQEFYEGLDMNLEQQVPISLVGSEALNECLRGERSGHYYLPQIPLGFFVSGEPEIIILYGLTRLQTGYVLAHEMMHAWLYLEGYRHLSRDVEEGMCQVMAHMWLDAELNVASQFERRLGEFFKHQIEMDCSQVYGDGFRAAHRAVQIYGLRSTIDHIGETGTFLC
ncbi:hypothetical protein FNV43_RR11444 [Rhamnella rubrinervis]|uniref:LIM zinc-binding domain-containing protein n=1 Tax=Rhamnella rubrinervis TaxID=2594499 RepID=A0A8K0H6A8_9ROSA|nr:hypothetical protein FNV43_RR11444 [Rhamnella rubrinervis]